MQVIKEKIIKGKPAQLVLEDGETTIKILYDGICIDCIEGTTWENIKDEDWIQEAFIDFAVDEYNDDNEIDSEFLAMVDELD